jgi:hypothetical protein
LLALQAVLNIWSSAAAAVVVASSRVVAELVDS